MPINDQYMSVEPPRADIDALSGAALVEFGSPECGHCAAVQPLLAAALLAHPGVNHLKVEDGRGRRLGRSFAVRLWPTLIFLRDGKEMARLVRPQTLAAIDDALAQIDPAA